jgi:calcineurin-like phosphoesterase family protein
MYWFTSDFHIGDERLDILGRKPPFLDVHDFTYKVLTNLNECVTKDDTLFVNGDLCYNAKENIAGMGVRSILASLPKCKRKYLIRGNHDRHISDEVFKEYFDEVVPEGKGIDVIVDGLLCYVTHYPTQAKSDRFNLVGHIHGAWKVQKNMLNVGIDAHHFYPINEKQVRFYYEAVCKFYDDDVWVSNHSANAEHISRGKVGSYYGKI